MECGGDIRIAQGPVIALVRHVVQTQQNGQQMQLSIQRHRVVFPFDGENRISAAACARLPDAAATLSADAWATVVPAEPYQSVCDSRR